MSTFTVHSGIPGVFYRRPMPTEPPFVEEGVKVEVGDTIGLVEIMKTFNPIIAEKSGIVGRFHVADSEEVAPGQAIAEIQLMDES